MSKKKDKEPLELLKNNVVQREILSYDDQKYFTSRIWNYYHSFDLNKPSCRGWYRGGRGTDIRIVVTSKKIHAAFITNDNIIACYRFVVDGLSKKETYYHEQIIRAKMLYDEASLCFADTNDLETLSTEIEEGLLMEHHHRVHDANGFELLRGRPRDNDLSDIPNIRVWDASNLKRSDIAYINGNFIATLIALKFPAVNISHNIFTESNPKAAYGYSPSRKMVDMILHDARMVDGDCALQTEDVTLALDVFENRTRISRPSDPDNEDLYRDPFDD